jgi:hypothetical protein
VWNGTKYVAKCDPNYSGFSIQISEAAKLLRSYLTNMTQPWWTYRKPYQSNKIAWAPGCSSASVYIENKATAALYTYTPYQPNKASLDNMYGEAPTCGAYGNRNFWRVFNDWFGSTHAINGNITLSKPLTVTPLVVGEPVTASYEVFNSSNYAASAGGLGICARINGQNYDFGYKTSNTVPANGKITVSYQRTFNTPGTISIFTCSYLKILGGWSDSKYPYNVDGLQRTAKSTIQDNPAITSSVAFSPASPVAGQEVTATFTIKNFGTTPINIGTPIIAVRNSRGTNVDFPIETGPITIAANSSYTYSKKRTFTSAGTYQYFMSDYVGGRWDVNYPRPNSTSITKSGSLTVKSNPLVTSGVAFSPTSPVAGQAVTATFTIKNFSKAAVNIGVPIIAVRSSRGVNVDFPIETGPITIAADSSYTYSKTRTFKSAGTYQYFVSDYVDSKWNVNYPMSYDPSIIRNGTLTIK